MAHEPTNKFLIDVTHIFTSARKWGIALSGVIIMFGKAIGDGDITMSEWLSILFAVLVAIGVYAIPNDDTVPTQPHARHVNNV